MQTKIILLELLLFFCFPVFSQTTAIPDQNFEQALIDQGIDSDGTINGQVPTADIDTVTELNITDLNIADLSGIEDFAQLQELHCGNPSMLPKNQFSSLDLSNNPNLTLLWATNMPSLTSINLKNGNNAILTDVNTTCYIEDSPPCDRPLCLEVDDVEAAQANESPYSSWEIYAPVTTFSDDCSLAIAKYQMENLKIFPNPTRGAITVESDRKIEKISLYSLNGKSLWKKLNPKKTIDLSNLENGLYFLKIYLHQKTEVKRLVKQ